MAHVATPEVVAPTPAEDDAAAPAIIAPPEDDAYNAVPATSPAVTPTQPSPWLSVVCDYSGASGPRLAKRIRRLSQSRSGSPVGVESTGAALLGKRKAEPSPTPAEKKRNYSYHRGGWLGQ